MLSGNRNFEGRINPVVRFNYLASPPLVVAYAIAGTMDFDPERDRSGDDREGNPVYLRDIWPTTREVAEAVASSIDSAMFRKEYGQVFDGDEHWRGLKVPEGDLFRWEKDSLYVKAPPFFDGVGATPPPVRDIKDARVLAMLARQRNHRSHLARRIDRGRHSGRQVSDRPRMSSRAISTPTARAAAIMK